MISTMNYKDYPKGTPTSFILTMARIKDIGCEGDCSCCGIIPGLKGATDKALEVFKRFYETYIAQGHKWPKAHPEVTWARYDRETQPAGKLIEIGWPWINGCKISFEIRDDLIVTFCLPPDFYLDGKPSWFRLETDADYLEAVRIISGYAQMTEEPYDS